jgi:glycine/D-amino acid oxidase-like deaminating enzyme
MKQIRDAVVIGSGIIGSATALALVRAGIKRVTCIEKGPLVSGMTRRNAGLAHPFHSHPVLRILADASYDFYSHWGLNLGGKSSFVETGAALIDNDRITSPSGAFSSEPFAGTQKVAPHALSSLFPSVSSALGAATFATRAGYADAVLCAQAMVNAAKERGL